MVAITPELHAEFERLSENMDKLGALADLAKGTRRHDAAQFALGEAIIESIKFLQHTGGWEPMGSVVN